MMAPTPFCAADPAPSPSESGPGTRLSLSAASRLARPQTPRLAAHVAAIDCQVCTQAVLPQPSGSCFQTHWYLHLLLRHCDEMVPKPFSYLARKFLHARDRRCHHRCHRRGTHPSTGTATEDGPLTSSPPRRGQSLGGALWTPAYTPATVKPVGCTPITLYMYLSCYVTVNKNQYCRTYRCAFFHSFFFTP
jgi:hypothetical protein